MSSNTFGSIFIDFNDSSNNSRLATSDRLVCPVSHLPPGRVIFPGLLTSSNSSTQNSF